MGVPILTLCGRAFASRVCASLVTAVGLPELVCNSSEEYIDRAVALANNPAEIARLKKKLTAVRDTCTLFDTDSLVRNLEGLYNTMWEDFRHGKLPRPDLTNADLYLEAGCELDHEGVEMVTVKDYSDLYKAKLARWHKYAPIHADCRLWTASDIAEAEGNLRIVASAEPAKRAPFLKKKR
jgi:hypothetical protein